MTKDLITYSYETWINALIGSTLVGLIGLLPIFIVPNEQSKSIFLLIVNNKINIFFV
jgi:hypothetical protein